MISLLKCILGTLYSTAHVFNSRVDNVGADTDANS